jgi:hypothetical protein
MTRSYKARAAIMIPTIPAVEAPILMMLAAPVGECEAAEPEAVPEAVEPEPEAEEAPGIISKI